MRPSPPTKLSQPSITANLRRISFEEAFSVVTAGAIAEPNELQQALFPRLSTQDTGLVIPTGPKAGRLEAIAIPSLLSMQVDEAAHRLFVVGPDLRPLDDYAYRLAQYIKNLVAADGVERTLWLEEPDRPPISRTYVADGTIINGAAHHPFSDRVDIVAMPFSHFRATFFGSGGIHALPEAAGYDIVAAESKAPRGLIYFDDAFGSSQEERDEFVKFVEYLFAQDLDIVVGSSSLPLTLRNELTALELVDVKSAQGQPSRKISYVSVETNGLLDTLSLQAKSKAGKSSRVALVFNSAADTRMSQIHDKLLGEQKTDLYLYQTNASRTERQKVYSKLLELEQAGRGYVVVIDGPALEASDLDLTTLVTEECEPLELVRRAGRCNRRGLSDDGEIVVIGEGNGPTGLSADPDLRRQISLAKALRSLTPETPYDSLYWEGFLD